ncbi:hypothetical protein RUM43_009340 [Polyplax serrata]|uniref:Uncharacterized protein n=1 Tax=Polyplax serrata TaxID=468196 RepID=A0AAN8PAN7_POLSC
MTKERNSKKKEINPRTNRQVKNSKNLRAESGKRVEECGELVMKKRGNGNRKLKGKKSRRRGDKKTIPTVI